MAALHSFLLFLPLLGGVSCTFSFFLPGKASDEYQGPAQFFHQQPDYSQQYLQPIHQQYLSSQDGPQYIQCNGDCGQQQLDYQQQQQPQQQQQDQQQPQQQLTSSEYWPANSQLQLQQQQQQQQQSQQQPQEQSADYQDQDPDAQGYRFQAYQSTYRHHVQSVNPYLSSAGSPYPNTFYHHSHQIQAGLPHYYHHQSLSPLSSGVPSLVVPTSQGVVPPLASGHRLAASPIASPALAGPLDATSLAGSGPLAPSTSSGLPVYQLITVGPELPVLVRLPNQQTAILPVRTVYSLPSFLERIVQRIPRPNETEPATVGEVISSNSSSSAADLTQKISTTTPATSSSGVGNTTMDSAGSDHSNSTVTEDKELSFKSGTTTEEDSVTSTQASEDDDAAATTVTDSNDVLETTTTK